MPIVTHHEACFLSLYLNRRGGTGIDKVCRNLSTRGKPSFSFPTISSSILLTNDIVNINQEEFYFQTPRNFPHTPDPPLAAARRLRAVVPEKTCFVCKKTKFPGLRSATAPAIQLQADKRSIGVEAIVKWRAVRLERFDICEVSGRFGSQSV
jgi:hypothetical protein